MLETLDYNRSFPGPVLLLFFCLVSLVCAPVTPGESGGGFGFRPICAQPRPWTKCAAAVSLSFPSRKCPPVWGLDFNLPHAALCLLLVEGPCTVMIVTRHIGS